MFDIIDGGSKTPEEKKRELNNRAEQLKVFVAHMRALESSIAQIKFITTKIEWDELNDRLTSCHDQILDTLSFVKNSSKIKKLDRDKVSKSSKDFLKVIK